MTIVKPAGAFVALSLGIASLFAACGGSSVAPAASTSPARAPAASANPAQAPASGQPAGQGPARIVASYSNILADNLPTWITKEAGIFEKHGLDVDLRLIESSTGVPALISGETQFSQLGGSEALSAAVGGADIVVLATLTPVYPFVFEVPASITSPAGLVGKKVGVSRIGSSSDIATRVGLRKVGLDPDKDVTFIQVGSAATRVTAMKSGAIQGGLAEPPETLSLEAQGFHPLFDMAKQDLPAVNFSVVAMRPYVSSHRDITQRYIDAIMEGIAREKADKAFSIQVLQKYFKSNDEQGMGVTWDYFAKEVTPAQPLPKADAFADAKAVLAKEAPKVANFDVQKILDATFVESAVNRGVGAGS